MGIYTLQNKHLTVSMNSFGAELVSIKTTDNMELIWQGERSVWPRHAPVLFPIVGKLKNNSYSYDGKQYSLPQHGFARDHDFFLIEKTDTVLEFEFTASEETLKSYPFHFSLIIRYELMNNRLTVSYKVFNPDNQDLLFSIGAHPGFNCKRNESETVNDYYLEFEDTNHLICEKLSDGLLTGEVYELNLKKSMMELNSALFDKDALVFKNKQIEHVKLISKKSETVVTLTCKDWPYFGIWTKKGCDDFICLEPWYGIADSVEGPGKMEEKEGIIKIMPHQEFNAVLSLEVTQ